MMPLSSTLTSEEIATQASEIEANGLIMEYIGLLLDRLDILTDCEEEGEERQILGSIRIVVDDGTVGEYLHNRPARETFLLCQPTLEGAYNFEALLAEWASDPDTIADVVETFRTDYPGSEGYNEYVDNAVDEIVEIFFNAIIIPPNSFLGVQLRKAALGAGYSC